MGVTTAIASLTNIIGPLLGGLAFDYIMVGAPYWIGAGLFILAGLLLWRLPVSQPVS
jgi:predicted MFS family arabinose efflux permease